MTKSILVIFFSSILAAGCALNTPPHGGSWRVYAPRDTLDQHKLLVANTSQPLSEWVAGPNTYSSLAECDAERQGLFEEARKEFAADLQAHPVTDPNTSLQRNEEIRLAAVAISLQSAQCIEDADACDRGLQSACIRYQARLNGEQERRAAMAAATYQVEQARQLQFEQNMHDQQMLQMQSMQPHYIMRLPGTPMTPTYQVW